MMRCCDAETETETVRPGGSACDAVAWCGAPVTKWTDRRAVLLDAEGRPVPTAGEAARERNPDARLHPWLVPADIVALGYPPERGLSASALSMRKARVLEDLAAFEAEGLIAFGGSPGRAALASATARHGPGVSASTGELLCVNR